MTWTYDSSLSTNRDKVRFLVQDTDTSDQLVSDEEITFALTESPNIYSAAALVARAIGLHFTRQASVSERHSRVWIDSQAQAEKYLRLAGELETQATISATVYAGGISIADRDARQDDADRVPNAFRVGMHDYLNDQSDTNTGQG